MFQFLIDHIGNLFTLVGAAVGLVATWFRLVARVDALKILHGTDIELLQKEMLMAGQANAKLRQDIERDLDRLKVLIETDLSNFKASYIESRIQSSAQNVSQQQEMKELRREIRELISENHKALIAEISWLKDKLLNHQHHRDVRSP